MEDPSDQGIRAIIDVFGMLAHVVHRHGHAGAHESRRHYSAGREAACRPPPSRRRRCLCRRRLVFAPRPVRRVLAWAPRPRRGTGAPRGSGVIPFRPAVVPTNLSHRVVLEPVVSGVTPFAPAAASASAVALATTSASLLRPRARVRCFRGAGSVARPLAGTVGVCACAFFLRRFCGRKSARLSINSWLLLWLGR